MGSLAQFLWHAPAEAHIGYQHPSHGGGRVCPFPANTGTDGRCGGRLLLNPSVLLQSVCPGDPILFSRCVEMGRTCRDQGLLFVSFLLSAFMQIG